MGIKYKFWLHFSVFNLAVLASIGLLMRYKIGFEFPHFEQKYLQHAHSHFAFAAWITQTIYVLMIRFLAAGTGGNMSAHYGKLLLLNAICSWGMLIAFTVQGYGPFSIGFSSGSILLSWVFAFIYLKDLKKVRSGNPAVSWLKAAHFFNVISCIGTFVLAYMMATHQVSQKLYLGSVYYYLHFQYNGWFFFACTGLLIGMLHRYAPDINFGRRAFQLFAYACIPAYLLSALWLNFDLWLIILIAAAAAAQLIAWIILLKPLKAALAQLKDRIPVYTFRLFALAGLSLSIKLLLQLASCIPSVSQLAFGFRPIVIAYLHLVLLAVFTLFLLTFIHGFIQIQRTKLNRAALLVFTAGIFINEAILGIQGIASFSYTLLPYANEALFAAAILMFGALLTLLLSLRKINYREPDHIDG